MKLSAHSTYDFFSDEFLLLLKASHATAFQNPLWLKLCYEKLAGDALIITAHDNDKLIFLAPLVKFKKHGLTFVSPLDCQVSDYNDILVDKDYSEHLQNNSQFQHDFYQLLGKHDVFHVEKAVEGEDSLNVLGQLFSYNKDFSAHRLPLTDNFNAMRESRYNPTMRRSLDKKLGKLSRKKGFELVEINNKQGLDEAFAALIQFRKGRFGNTKANDLTQIKLYQDFYKSYAEDGFENYARTFLLKCENQPIAVTLGLNHQDAHGKTTHHVVLLAYDTENWANWSPGLAVLDKIAEQLTNEGASLLDLTIGDEPYKYLFGVSSTKIQTLMRPRTLKGALYFTSFKLGAPVKRFIKKLVRG